MSLRIPVFAGEPIQSALRRFKRKLEREGISREIRRQSPGKSSPRSANQLRRAKQFRKRFKARKATLDAQMAGQQSVDSLTDANAKFWKRRGKP